MLNNADDNTYLFKRDSESLAEYLGKYISKWNTFGVSSGYHDRWARAYNAYYGNYYGALGLGISGEAGHLTDMCVNHLRNIIKHIYNMSSQNRLVFDSLALNSDVQSRNDSIVSNAVVDYFFYDKNFEKDCKRALEMSLIFSTSYLYVSWEPYKEIHGIDGDGEVVYRGAPGMKALSPYDVVLESNLKDDFKDQNWIGIREVANRHDLIAIYSDKEKEILDLPEITDYSSFFSTGTRRNKDNVVVYKFFHKQTPALPKGRYIVICDNGVVLLDRNENPYGGLPVFELVPDARFGMAYGHNTLLDLLPAQEAHNSLMSSIITNQRAYATQNICVPKQSDISRAELAGDLNVVLYTADSELPGGGKPEALQLCATPTEVFNFQRELISQMEQVSGVNASSRGNPPPSATSGTAIALISASAQSFNGVVESSYIKMCENAASFLVEILKKFMRYEELIAISGSSNTYAVQAFKGEDLKNIRRVRIVTGNALSKTLSGRVSMADTLLASQQINPQQYLEVMQTGSLARTIEDKTLEEAFVKQKTELLGQGIKVPALIYDNHPLFISALKLLTMRPDIRLNSDVLAIVLEGLQEHIDFLVQLTQMAGKDPIGGLKMAIALNQPINIAPPPPPQPGQPQGGGGGQPPPQPQLGQEMEGAPQPDQNSTDVQSSALSAQQRASKELDEADQAVAA